MKVSVVTAVRNGGKTIQSCLASVASQSGVDCEHVIVDGVSTDDTLNVVRGFPGRRGPLVSEPDRGLYDALNKGIGIATGDVIGVLGADDEYADPGVLAAVVETLERSRAESCYGDLVYVSEENPSRIVRHWRSGPLRSGAFRRGWMPPHPTFFVRKRIFEEFGGFDLRFRIASDYELMLRFLEKHRISTAYIPRVLVRMRLGGMSNRGIRRLVRKSREDRFAWEVNGLDGGWGTIALKNVSKLPQFFRRPGRV